jgi:signal transduction histidine kinase
MILKLPAFTIKAKIVLAYTLVFGLLISALSVVVYRSSRDAKIARIDALLAAHAGKVLTEVEEDYDEGQPPDAVDLLALQTEGLPGLRLQLLLPSGEKLLRDSLLPPLEAGLLAKTFQGSVEHQTFLVRHRAYRVLWQPVEIDERTPYVLQVAVPLHDVNEDLERLRMIFLIAIPVTLMLTGLAAFGITRAAFRPIITMTETTRTITTANLHSRLELPLADDEVRRLGETLNDLMERLDSAFRNQKQFVADASHELRTPLTIMRTELEYALSQVSGAAAKESIQTTLAEIDRLTRMAGQLLTLAKLDASPQDLQMQTGRLDELLVECVQLAIPLAAKRDMRIEVFIEAAVEVTLDSEKLKSVILNLLDNAMNYSSEGSSIKASLRLNPPSAVRLIVEDDGPGIPAGELPLVFKRFYRGDAHRGQSTGSGLGLAIAQRIVELHRGTMAVHSEEGNGATFTIELPYSAAS